MEEALNLFRFRTRMAEFGKNYKAGAAFVCCPLYSKEGDLLMELDNQAHSFQCNSIKKEIEIKGEPSDVYMANITKEMAQTITTIVNIRKKLLRQEDN